MFINSRALLALHLLVVQILGFNVFQALTDLYSPQVSLPGSNKAQGSLVLDKLINQFNDNSLIKNNEEFASLWLNLLQQFSPQELQEYADQLIAARVEPGTEFNKVKSVLSSNKWQYTSKNKGYALRDRETTFPELLGVDTVKQFSGYFDIEKENKHFFYWFFESRNDPANDPIVLWLNGGPGCSSMTGLFFELGPSSIGHDLKPINNKFSWNSNASVIFLDQPVNAGFSYAPELSTHQVLTSKQALKDAYQFLDLFFTRFSQFQKSKFHIAGESYLGHYIPALAHEIIQHDDRIFDFTSVMIGNGVTDSKTQSLSYRPMACGEGGYPAVISEQECEMLAENEPKCQALIDFCYKYPSPLTCTFIPGLSCGKLMEPYENTGKNVYDIRVDCGESALCYDDITYIEEYLNQPAVLALLGVEVSNFTSCSQSVGLRFLLAGDLYLPHQQYIAELLELGFPVLIYAGDKDYICNWIGNKMWTDLLEWEGMYGFQLSPIHKLTSSINGTDIGVGEIKSFSNFTYYRVYDAGHMVPYNQPEVSLKMLNTWIGGDYTFGL